MIKKESKKKPQQLDTPELKTVYGGAGEITSNYLAIKAHDTKTDPPEKVA